MLTASVTLDTNLRGGKKKRVKSNAANLAKCTGLVQFLTEDVSINV